MTIELSGHRGPLPVHAEVRSIEPARPHGTTTLRLSGVQIARDAGVWP